MTAVFKRELRALLGGLTGWGFLAALLAAAGASVFAVNVLGASAVFADNAHYLALGMAVACALACATAFSAERAQNTERLLYALPLRSGAIFLGKLLARLVVMLLGCALLALYPIVLSLLIPDMAAGEGLSCVVAVCAIGALGMAAALCCAACTRTAVGALVAFALIAALSCLLPLAAPRVAALTRLTLPMLVIIPALAGVIVHLIFNDVLIGFIGAAVALAPVLLCYLRGNGAAVFGFLARAMRAVSVTAPLSAFVNGTLDLAALIRWLSLAAVFAVAGVVAVAARRRAERKAL